MGSSEEESPPASCRAGTAARQVGGGSVGGRGVSAGDANYGADDVAEAGSGTETA
jgi:hypothetical protein